MIVADRTLVQIKGNSLIRYRFYPILFKTLKWKRKEKKKVNVNNTRMTTEQNVMLI